MNLTGQIALSEQQNNIMKKLLIERMRGVTIKYNINYEWKHKIYDYGITATKHDALYNAIEKFQKLNTSTFWKKIIYYKPECEYWLKKENKNNSLIRKAIQKFLGIILY